MIELIGLSLVIILSVLLFGGVENWAAALSGILILVFFNLSFISNLRRGGKFFFIHKSLLVSMALFLSFSVLQIIPLPPGLLQYLSPEKYSFVERLSLSSLQSLSVYPYATLHAIVKGILYLMVFAMAVVLARKRNLLLTFINVIIFFSFLLSIFALIQKGTWNGKIYWFRELSIVSVPFGPYVNRNHFAGFIEMIIPLSLALGVYYREYAKRFFYIFCSVIMCFALFISLSRGGIVSFTVGFAFYTLMSIHEKKESKPMIFLILFVMLLISFLVYMGIHPLIERFTTMEAVRVHMWNSFLDAATDFWLVGSGLGTFSHIAHLYHPEGSTSFYDHAHNDYLEFFIEMGFIGSVLFLFLVVSILTRIVTSLWRQKAEFYIVLAGLTSIVSVSVHSLVDFNLHILSNALMLSVIIGFTYGISQNDFGRNPVIGRS
jgi:O-antigen ligase